MLALMRREKQKLNIYIPNRNPITITIVRIGSHQVKLGIECDRDIDIERPDARAILHREAQKNQQTGKGTR